MEKFFSKSHLYKSLINEYQQDIRQIKENIINNNNTFLYFDPDNSIEFLLNTVQQELQESHFVLYFDLKKVYSPKSLLGYMTKVLLRSHSSKLQEIFDFAGKFMPNLKPEIKHNSITTEININYSINEEVIYGFIKELFDTFEQIADHLNKSVLVIFNNFDKIVNIDKRKTEEIIRNKISTNIKVNYIFSCSHEKTVSKIFPKKYAAKYKIKKMQIIDPPALKPVSNYIVKSFAKKNIQIPPLTAENLYRTAGNVHNLLLLCKKIQVALEESQRNKRFTPATLKLAINEIISDMDPVYSNQWDSLSRHQKILLSTIAQKGGTQVFSAKFLFENDLGSAPSVQTSINALLKKNILFKSNTEFVFCDNIFKEWLKRLLI